MFSNALKKMSGREPNIICITQITCKFVNNAMLIYKGRLSFYHFNVVHNFSACKHWLKTMLICAHHLSSSPDVFANECNNLKTLDRLKLYDVILTTLTRKSEENKTKRKENSPFTIHEKHHFGILRFTENRKRFKSKALCATTVFFFGSGNELLNSENELLINEDLSNRNAV